MACQKNLCKTIPRHATNKFTAGFLRGEFFPFHSCLWPTRFFLTFLSVVVGLEKRFIFVLLYYYGFLIRRAATLHLSSCVLLSFIDIFIDCQVFRTDKSANYYLLCIYSRFCLFYILEYTNKRINNRY